MSRPQTIALLSPQEYYLREQHATVKSDYYRGEIFAMSGGTPRHSLIIGNVLGEVHSRLKGKPCTAYDSNLRLRIPGSTLRTYPDASVYCQKLKLDPEDPSGTTATNPTVIFEVLSPSTEAYDRGLKSTEYRTMVSLQALVLVWQDQPRLEIFQRHQDQWMFREAIGMESSLHIASLEIDLPLGEVYDRVEFETRPDVAS